MNLKELIDVYQGMVENKDKSGAIRGTYKKVLKDLKELDELTELKGVKIPQCAIDVMGESFKNQEYTLFEAMSPNDKSEEFRNWIESPMNQELFAHAWIEGYIETRYIVKIKNSNSVFCYLVHDFKNKCWCWENDKIDRDSVIVRDQALFRHSRKELEEAGFGEVFTSSLFELEEAEVRFFRVKQNQQQGE